MSERPAWVRPAALAAAGAATFAVAYHFSGSGSDGVVESVARTGSAAASTGVAIPGAGPTPAEAAPSAAAVPGAPSLPTRSRITEGASKDPFAARGWLPPPPPPPPPLAEAPPPPPPPPTAPPVPFRFVGLLEEKSAKPAAFIAKGDALFVVHVGDVVESTYRIESFNSAQVVVTYLPLQQRQTIEANGG
ncbi:MAG TPA: hypothetical protein VH278_00125 [Burkholderiaceae bacterium]|jgi:hypothetical protein|nr:hypothetical protein [Burkholderiaceae bacterium]